MGVFGQIQSTPKPKAVNAPSLPKIKPQAPVPFKSSVFGGNNSRPPMKPPMNAPMAQGPMNQPGPMSQPSGIGPSAQMMSPRITNLPNQPQGDMSSGANTVPQFQPTPQLQGQMQGGIGPSAALMGQNPQMGFGQSLQAGRVPPDMQQNLMNQQEGLKRQLMNQRQM